MISVLMSTYNREKYLKQAIDSVLNQTYKDLEFIIVDDGSTDDSRKIIESYTDERIKYLPLEENSYYCYAANYGLEHCTGEYVAFMNSDDEWLPHKLETQMRFMEENQEYGACFSAVFLMDSEGNDITDICVEMRDLFAKRFATQKEWMENFLYHKNCLCHPSALVKREVLERVGGFNLMYCQLADYDLWIRIVTEIPIYVLSDRLIKFRWDIAKNDQVSSFSEAKMARAHNEHMMIRRNMIERLSDEQVINFFGDRFKNKSSSTHLEIEFEKAFLLASCMEESPDWKILGIEKLEKVLRQSGAMETLKNHFGISIFDIYEWNKTRMYRDPWILDEFESQKKRITQQDAEIGFLKNKVEEVLNSSSWKITAPLRHVASWFRK